MTETAPHDPGMNRPAVAEDGQDPPAGDDTPVIDAEPDDKPAPKKRASSRTAKKAASEHPIVGPADDSHHRPPVFAPEQQARLEAVTVARGIIGTETRGGFSGGKLPANAIAICDLAEYILTGVHPLGSAAVELAHNQAAGTADHDDGGPGGLTYVAPTTPTGVTA